MSIVGDTGDGEVGRADHKVLMCHGDIKTALTELVLRHGLSTLYAGICLAESKVARGVLIKQSVVEKYTGL